MKQRERRIKRHIISLRVSTEEWNSMHEVMKGLECKHVSDFMREAFKLVLALPPSFHAAGEGQERSG